MLNGLLGMLASGFAGTGLAIHQNLKGNGEKGSIRLATGTFTGAFGILAVCVSLKSAGVFLLSLTSFLVSLVVMCCMCVSGNASENERQKETQKGNYG